MEPKIDSLQVKYNSVELSDLDYFSFILWQRVRM